MRAGFWRWRFSDAAAGFSAGVTSALYSLSRGTEVIDCILAGVIVTLTIVLLAPVLRRLVHSRSVEEKLEEDD